jgi:hypothetical protein
MSTPNPFTSTEQQEVGASADPTLLASLEGQTNSMIGDYTNLEAEGKITATGEANGIAQQESEFNKENTAINTVSTDLANNDYSGAITAAEMGANWTATPESASMDNPVLQALMTPAGLQSLDPSKQWTAANDTALFKAIFASNPNALGANEYGQWGNPADAASDAAKAAAGGAPNIQADLGARQSEGNALEKATPYINAAELAVIGGFAAAPLTAAAGGGALGAGVAGAEIGAGSTAITDVEEGKAVTAGSVGEGAAVGALTAEAKPLTGALSNEISSTTGLGSTASGVLAGGLTGAGLGAAKGALTGTGAESSAVGGAVGGAVVGGVSGSGLQQSITDTTGSSVVGNVATNAAAGELTNIAGSTLTSPSGQSATTTSGESVSTPNPVGASPTSTSSDPLASAPSVASTPAPASFGTDIVNGITSTLGGGSLGTSLGTLAPYAAVAGIGEAQAAAGQKQDAAAAQTQENLAAPAIGESSTLLGNYNSGTLNSADQAVVNTGIAQGQSTIASANGLSAIAQTAFANYNNGTLTAGDQAALDAQTAAAKQQVAQQLSSAGITDSTILAAQYQNIDNQALISKQNTLNGYFATGNSAYDSWLTATTEGQATITAAQTFASTSLNNYLTQSMNEANIGMGEMNTAIQTQMQTDQEYAAQVSTLLGTLATSYAKQIAGQQTGTGSANSAANILKGAGGGSSGSSSASNPDNDPANQETIGETADSEAAGANAQLDQSLSGGLPGFSLGGDVGSNTATDIPAYASDGSDLAIGS